MAFVPGMKVRYAPQPDWGVGHLVRLHQDGSLAEVLFPGRGTADAGLHQGEGAGGRTPSWPATGW